MGGGPAACGASLSVLTCPDCWGDFAGEKLDAFGNVLERLATDIDLPDKALAADLVLEDQDLVDHLLHAATHQRALRRQHLGKGRWRHRPLNIGRR